MLWPLALAGASSSPVPPTGLADLSGDRRSDQRSPPSPAWHTLADVSPSALPQRTFPSHSVLRVHFQGTQSDTNNDFINSTNIYQVPTVQCNVLGPGDTRVKDTQQFPTRGKRTRGLDLFLTKGRTNQFSYFLPNTKYIFNWIYFNHVFETKH